MNTKRPTGVEEDRISRLPDEILIDILSVLPTKDAVTTCILSKRWLDLWKFVHNFIFSSKNESAFNDASTDSKEFCPQNYSYFVENVLKHSKSKKIAKFFLDGEKLSEYRSQIKTWISFAVEKGVEDLVFWSSNGSITELPSSFFSCSSLTSLHLRYCSIPNAFMAWKCLKILTLGDMKLNNDQILKLMSCSPALEAMELYNFCGLSSLHIKSSSVKKLMLKNQINDTDDIPLKIVAPFLEHLDITGHIREKYVLVNVSCLTYAKLSLHFTCIKHKRSRGGVYGQYCYDDHRSNKKLLQAYLKELSSATHLTLGPWFTLLKELQSLDLNCEKLSLELFLANINLTGLLHLFEVSRQVESLNIYITENQLARFLCTDTDRVNQLSNFSCPKLKMVVIANSFQACLKLDAPRRRGFEKLLLFFKLLLRNAPNLEEFRIMSNQTECESCSLMCEADFTVDLFKKIRGLPRSSKKVNILFNQQYSR